MITTIISRIQFALAVIVLPNSPPQITKSHPEVRAVSVCNQCQPMPDRLSWPEWDISKGKFSMLSHSIGGKVGTKRTPLSKSFLAQKRQFCCISSPGTRQSVRTIWSQSPGSYLRSHDSGNGVCIRVSPIFILFGFGVDLGITLIFIGNMIQLRKILSNNGPFFPLLTQSLGSFSDKVLIFSPHWMYAAEMDRIQKGPLFHSLEYTSLTIPYSSRKQYVKAGKFWFFTAQLPVTQPWSHARSLPCWWHRLEKVSAGSWLIAICMHRSYECIDHRQFLRW